MCLVQEGLTIPGSYWFFAGVGVLAAIYGATILPDTQVALVVLADIYSTTILPDTQIVQLVLAINYYVHFLDILEY